MAYSIYWYIRNDAFKEAATGNTEYARLADSTMFQRAKERLYGKPPGNTPVFGWIKPRELDRVFEIVQELTAVSQYLTEVTDDHLHRNELHIEFWELMDKATEQDEKLAKISRKQ